MSDLKPPLGMELDRRMEKRLKLDWSNFSGLVFIAFVFVMINFIVDILYYFIDPRIRVKGEAVSG